VARLWLTKGFKVFCLSFAMEEVSDTVGSHDSGRYDNDFEKLPHYEEEVIPKSEPLARPGSPSGDAMSTDSATAGVETEPSPSKSQLNVDEPSDKKPPPATTDIGGDKGTVCASCESSRT